MKNKAFTLIELLAVIIILGILMLIAIPSVTSYINNSRKETYVNTVKELLQATSVMVNSGELEINDPNTTYYVPTSAISLENGDAQSPYGKFEPAYIAVTYDGEEYNYYFVGKDDKDMGVPTLTKGELVDKDKIEPNVDDIDTTIGIGDRDKIIVFKQDLSKEEVTPTSFIPDKIITYPEGKNKYTVEVGDIIKIYDEEFYLIGHQDNHLVLITRYNINVGPYKKSGIPEGVQDPSLNGNGAAGIVKFSNSAYWVGQVGEGLKYPGSYKYDDSNFPYVYDENSNVYTYVNNYKSYIESKGVEVVEARLMSFAESRNFLCPRYSSSDPTCPCGSSFLDTISFWLGNAHSNTDVYKHVTASSTCYYGVTDYTSGYGGVRPVIVV